MIHGWPFGGEECSTGAHAIIIDKRNEERRFIGIVQEKEFRLEIPFQKTIGDALVYFETVSRLLAFV
jgi:hypothetical protein